MCFLSQRMAREYSFLGVLAFIFPFVFLFIFIFKYLFNVIFSFHLLILDKTFK